MCTKAENNPLNVFVLMFSWKGEFVARQVVICGGKKEGLSEGNNADKHSLLFDRNNCSPKTTKERTVETRKFHLFPPLKREYSDIHRNNFLDFLWLDSDL
jgi:hypothetical protein